MPPPPKVTRKFQLGQRRLAEVREKLAQQRAACPVFDTDLYRQHLESAYLTLCERERRAEPKGPLKVSAIR